MLAGVEGTSREGVVSNAVARCVVRMCTATVGDGQSPTGEAQLRCCEPVVEVALDAYDKRKGPLPIQVQPLHFLCSLQPYGIANTQAWWLATELSARCVVIPALACARKSRQE